MYRTRTPGFRKSDQAMRWNLPDRVFFACGACHILACAFMQKFSAYSCKPIWIKPEKGFTGNHIIVMGDGWLFDYHGYSDPKKYMKHTWKKAVMWWPGWDASLVEIRPTALVSGAESLTYEGLHLREPTQFLLNAMPRAQAYLERFPLPPR